MVGQKLAQANLTGNGMHLQAMIGCQEYLIDLRCSAYEDGCLKDGDCDGM